MIFLFSETPYMSYNKIIFYSQFFSNLFSYILVI